MSLLGPRHLLVTSHEDGPAIDNNHLTDDERDPSVSFKVARLVA